VTSLSTYVGSSLSTTTVTSTTSVQGPRQTIYCGVPGLQRVGAVSFMPPTTLPAVPSTAQCLAVCLATTGCLSFIRTKEFGVTMCSFFKVSLPNSIQVITNLPSLTTSYGYDVGCPASSFVQRRELAAVAISEDHLDKRIITQCSAASSFNDVCSCMGIFPSTITTTITLAPSVS
jgi:hypothetical protein